MQDVMGDELETKYRLSYIYSIHKHLKGNTKGVEKFITIKI